MASSSNAPGSKAGNVSYADAAAPQRPTASNDQGSASTAPAKKRKHRGGKKRRNRRQSFAATAAMGAGDTEDDARPSVADMGHSGSRGGNSFYRSRNASNTSLESEALLDHRGQTHLPPRRGSVQVPAVYQPRPARNSPSTPARPQPGYQQPRVESDDGDDDEDHDDRTPLIGASYRNKNSASYGGLGTMGGGKARPISRSSHDSSRARPAFVQHHSQNDLGDYDVNNPPSVPTSPVLGPEVGFDDVMLAIDMERDRSPEDARARTKSRDHLIDIDEPAQDEQYPSNRSSPQGLSEFRRRMTLKATDDVCFPTEGMSDIGDHDYQRPERDDARGRRRRRRWPDLAILDAWAHEEKEQRTVEGMRMRKVSEPLMVGGRLRPQKRPWHREAEDAPFRFTYFNEEFDNTIHSQTISELVQPGQTFRNLFIPERPILEDSSDGETDTEDEELTRANTRASATNGLSRATSVSQVPSRLGEVKQDTSGERTRSATPLSMKSPKGDTDKPVRYGPRPTFWLDVLSPTETEMKVLAKAFSIHPLTAEDILMQEAREKVELFKHYYFINYRSFEQDETSEDHMEPVNIYTIVFREGVISFHFSMTPHPANVRRRIRQLQDYLILSPDWISYAIIDDITDAYAPSIQKIEDEVDEIDEDILRLHSEEEKQEVEKSKSASYNNPHYEKPEDGTKEQQDGGRDMLRRVGECRKRVMGLYRLLGNKADVIKGFAKRCNEQWDVAPRSEIGLYLGDIQDHIVTMTGNLTHYENLLSRAHSNYLAQINIRMNERQEKTSDILGKLTVLGTIVLPMNVVTGIWGMNCLVPGQDIETLTWFWCITGGLVLFGMICYFIAKRVYGIM